MQSIQFELTTEAEKATDLWIIPAEIYKGIKMILLLSQTIPMS